MNKRNVVMQLFGCIMKNPLLLGEINTYNLTPNDFHKPLDKQIFAALYNLYTGGAERITVVDIDNYLKGHEAIYPNFIKNNGIEYLQDAEDLSVSENFNYYYQTLKKENAIHDLKSSGFDVDFLYPTDLDENAEKKMAKFDAMEVQDIFDAVRDKFARIEGQYTSGSNTKTSLAIDGIEELIANLAISPEIGPSLQGSCFNTVVRGARRGMFYLQSSGTGVGKTRGMIGDACMLAYPLRYNWDKLMWEMVGGQEKVLYVGTEQTIAEIQTLVLAYLTGINEEKIMYARYSPEEKIVLQQAIQVMEIYKENLVLVQLPDPNIQLIKGVIRKECLTKDIGYVFYDYIFSSPGLLGEFRDLKIREDVVLGMLSTALKDIAVELNVFMKSATQISGDLDAGKGIRDQRYIRGSKAVADKVDCGVVVARVNTEELVTLAQLMNEKGLNPNQVTDVYKLRRGRYNNVRIWSEVDLGTCRRTDLFMTDAEFKPVQGFVPTFRETDFSANDDVVSVLKFLNGDKVEQEPVVEEVVEEAPIDFANPNNWAF